MTALQELTLDELTSSLRAQTDLSEPNDIGAWNTLVRLAEGLDRGDGHNYLIKDRRWLLQRLSVEGFRGAKQEVKLKVANATGVTVLYGQNGSGKSSLAEAVRVALEGRTGATHLGANGTLHELWGSSDERSRGAESAKIMVHLMDETTNDQLSITAVVTAAGVRRTGLLTSNGVDQTVAEDSAAWQPWIEALRASPPVLAYAELADELQKKRDLQNWLTSCLAMDNATRVFDSYVKVHVDAATDAARLISTAKATSVSKIEDVDAQARQNGLGQIQPLVWTDFNSEKELREWLVLNKLSERKALEDQFEKSFMETVLEYSRMYSKALASWSSESSKALLTPQVTDSVIEMHKHVIESRQGSNEDMCPVCGTVETRWREHLRSEVERLQTAKTAAAALRNLVREYSAKLAHPLKAALAVLPKHSDTQSAITLAALISDLEKTSPAAGPLDVQLLARLDSLANWALSADAQIFMEAAVAESGLEHQWRSQRWNALSDYFTIFNAKIKDASQLAILKKARTKWNSHLAHMRKDRSSTLQSLVGPAVASLLEDVGISVKAIDITKSESRLELENAKGEPVALAHLSAGQRNALILGPVIATAESGIFGFAILDDPVHAFDDFRVDKLSSTLSKVGSKQSLIITTHDARFVEYLRVHGRSEFSVLSTHRTPDGEVTLTPTLDPPRELINFAKELAKDLRNRQATEGQGEVNALLRMAVDESFEQIALRHLARLPVAAVEQARAEFASAMTTAERKDVLRGFLGDSPSQLIHLTNAWQILSTPVKRWSTGIHASAAAVDYQQLDDDVSTASSAVAHMDHVSWF
ncbi:MULTISPECIES: AAA family ATPase [Clavibacter]|uniref:AAA family ATPase n=1 Tax=Clavibacter seminis TaxID=2860285 RepID=A0ABY3TCQ9_9MICO|nr:MULTISPECIES: AAA family ATPase [Clavibacter]UKF25807.1 AAA family ATPase [Clavibacter sp. A6099]